MSPEATGSTGRSASAGRARRSASASDAPTKIAIELVPGRTMARPRPEADGTNARARAGSARSSRTSAAPSAAPAAIATRADGWSAPTPAARTRDTPAHTCAHGRGELLRAEHARVGHEQIEHRHDRRRADHGAEELGRELRARASAEEVAALEVGQEVRRVEADATGDIRPHEVRDELPGEEPAVHELRERAERLRRRGVGLAGDARRHEAQHDRERDRERPDPERDPEQRPHEQDDHAAEHEQPPTNQDAGASMAASGSSADPPRTARPRPPNDAATLRHCSAKVSEPELTSIRGPPQSVQWTIARYETASMTPRANIAGASTP